MRILLIGCSKRYVPTTLCDSGVETIGGQDDLRSVESMEISSHDQTAQLSSLQVSDYDFIVIGNNLGSGGKKAAFVPPSLRSSVVIVWNEEPPDDEVSLYLLDGFQHFCSRGQLGEKLEQLCKGYGGLHDVRHK